MEIQRGGGSGNVQHRSRLGQNIAFHGDITAVVQDPGAPPVRIGQQHGCSFGRKTSARSEVDGRHRQRGSHRKVRRDGKRGVALHRNPAGRRLDRTQSDDHITFEMHPTERVGSDA